MLLECLYQTIPLIELQKTERNRRFALFKFWDPSLGELPVRTQTHSIKIVYAKMLLVIFLFLLFEQVQT